MKTYDILGICGSLRAKSYNRYALEAAGELMPGSMKLRITSYADIPLYNQDEQEQNGMPAAVVRLRDEIARADALLIASPEYNWSITGVLKNAIDWVSRFPNQPFKDKPVAIISAALGHLGGARNQYDLRKIICSLDGLVLTRPEIFIGQCQSRFDPQGRLVDDPTRKILGDQMMAFERWIARLGAV